MRPKIKIHFVCRGNIFRSRLAEAYAKSLKGSEWEISSSGITENRFANRELSPWANAIGRKYGFAEHFNAGSTQTTSQILRQQDIIIFMKDDVFQSAAQRYDFNPGKCVVWNIKDREDWPEKLSLAVKRQRTFKRIKRSTGQLIKDIERGGWVDIVDENNKPLGYSMPITIANKNSLWHRTAHAIIVTPSNKVLVQKRSKRIFFSPGLVDISLGGHVDPGESPEEAIKREITEETGLQVGGLRLLELHKSNTYHPHRKVHTKCFVYSFSAPVPENHPQLLPQKSEVAELLFLEPNALHRLVADRTFKGLGSLNYPYDFYSRNIKLAGIF